MVQSGWLYLSVNQAIKHSDVYGSSGPIIEQGTRLIDWLIDWMSTVMHGTEYWRRSLIIPCSRDGTVWPAQIMLNWPVPRCSRDWPFSLPFAVPATPVPNHSTLPTARPFPHAPHCPDAAGHPSWPAARPSACPDHPVASTYCPSNPAADESCHFQNYLNNRKILFQASLAMRRRKITENYVKILEGP